MSIPSRRLGKNGPAVPVIGFGLMGMSAFYGKPMTDEDAFSLLDRAIELGSTFWDTSDAYGGNEELLGRYFRARPGAREKVFLATKFGIVTEDGKPTGRGDAAYVEQQLNASLAKLGVSYIDLYYIHRIDTRVPIEVTMRTLSGFVKAGKIKHIGVSEASAATLRRAHAVHPLAALQMEYSAFALAFEDESAGLAKTCHDLGITLVAYAPLGRGILTGRIKSPNDFEEGDFRLGDPRYSAENFHKNLEIVDKLKVFADRHQATTGQVALAWLLAQGDDIVTIPGTTKVQNLEENLGAVKVHLSAEELKELDEVVRSADIKGERYPQSFAVLNLGETPEEK
jgi:aryl-alcohol dehydrogenase-like predicted oxidoreductase